MAEADIKDRIEARIGQGEFLTNMLLVTRQQSGQTHTDFVENLSGIAGSVRALLENNDLLRCIDYAPNKYWSGLHGKTFAFLDGGVANIELPSAAPIGIRVGSYIVRPGDASERREQFNIELSLVDDLFSDSGFLFESDFLDVAKLRDAARIVSEVAAGYRVAKAVGKDKVDAVILHGPLINPVAPYGLEDFPSFGRAACRTLLDDNDWDDDENKRQFVALYLTVLKRLRETGTPVVGAVERSIGRDPVFLRHLLNRLKDKKVLKKKDADNLELQILSYGLNDASLLDIVLGDGEYVAPIPIMRQGPKNKWPEKWYEEIDKYPNAFTTYIKPSTMVMPFRVEAFEDIKGFKDLLALIFYTSRLLPSYGFPVGLDIVDRFAKVPAWLSRGVKGQHQLVLLRQAIKSGDPRTVAFAKRVLAAKGRDWLFRPST